jgi:ABC-2 type transport system ATP-binding protein
MSIHLLGVTKRYGNVTALHPLDLKVNGEIYGLIGNNGAGKSTLMKIITGLLPPDAGKVEVSGIDIRKEPEEAKRRVGYLPESPLLYPRLTAEEMLTYIAEVKGVASPSEEVRHWLATFDLTEKKGALLSDLSFGMRKKVALSAAFLGKPPVLILDEPFNGLDVATMERLAGIITDFHRAGATVLLSSHLMEYVDRLCHRILILKKGSVVGEGTPQALKQKARSASFHDTFLYFTRETAGEK